MIHEHRFQDLKIECVSSFIPWFCFFDTWVGSGAPCGQPESSVPKVQLHSLGLRTLSIPPYSSWGTAAFSVGQQSFQTHERLYQR